MKLTREDIKEIFRGHKNNLNPAFFYRYDSKKIPNGKYYLDIVIKDEDGNSAEVGMRSISILNS